jgi:hypothetical protein
MGERLMPALGGSEISARLKHPRLVDRLIVAPLLAPDEQLRDDQASIDIRLGFEFALVSPTVRGSIDEFSGGTLAATFVGLPIVGKHTEVDYRLDERLLQCSEEYSHDGLQKIRHKQEAGREVTEANLGLGVDEGLLVDAADALQVADVILGCCWRRRPAASSRANTRALPRLGRSTQAGDGDFILIWRH